VRVRPYWRAQRFWPNGRQDKQARPILLAGFLFGDTLARCRTALHRAQSGVPSNLVCSDHCVFPPLLLQTRFARNAIQGWGKAIQQKALEGMGQPDIAD
jgi:hypothetical protein